MLSQNKLSQIYHKINITSFDVNNFLKKYFTLYINRFILYSYSSLI